MAETKIEWTHWPGRLGRTWNPVRGCSHATTRAYGKKVSSRRGCKNCYAEREAGRHSGWIKATGEPDTFNGFAILNNGPHWTGKVELKEHKLLEPLSWRKPACVFVNSMSDLFHERLSDEEIDQVFAVTALCPEHVFLILTKRAERMRDYFADNDRWSYIEGTAQRMFAERYPKEREDVSLWLAVNGPLPNVGLGISAEDDPTLQESWPFLGETPAAFRFISYEPALGPVDVRPLVFPAPAKITERCTGCHLTRCKLCHGTGRVERSVIPPRPDWIIAGGESGPKARPSHPAWYRDVRDDCVLAGVQFFFKQWGGWQQTTPVAGGDLVGDVRRGVVEVVRPAGEPDGHFRRGDVWMRRVGKKAAGRLLDGP